MRRYLLDTGIAGDFIHHRGPVRQRALDEARRGTLSASVVPVLAGAILRGREQRHPRPQPPTPPRGTRVLQDLAIHNAAAARYGRLRAELDRIGRPMGRMDILIAAIALTIGNCTVVSSDSDLAASRG